ncbi:hypothetical protein [Arthrobacter sp. H20]|uniref:hypothetical protein n=1 Tax=Arthrobacter sp. H20 TaxID=1267981 RepID=UPI00047B1ACC|nr:hypothetical protein [Arthrobacter sp. H20]
MGAKPTYREVLAVFETAYLRVHTKNEWNELAAADRSKDTSASTSSDWYRAQIELMGGVITELRSIGVAAADPMNHHLGILGFGDPADGSRFVSFDPRDWDFEYAFARDYEEIVASFRSTVDDAIEINALLL